MIETNSFFRKLIDPTYLAIDNSNTNNIVKNVKIKRNKTNKGSLVIVSYGNTKFSCEVDIKVGVPSSSFPNQGELSEFNTLLTCIMTRCQIKLIINILNRVSIVSLDNM